MLLLPFGRVRPGAIAAVILVAVFAAVIPGVRAQQPRGLVTNLPGAFQGYTVVAPLKSTSTYLVDMDGETVHEWRSRYTPTFGIYVLDNGNLLRAARDPNNSLFNVGGYGGIVQELAWNGGVVWEYRYSSREHIQHHDIELLPNGNILLLAWERMTAPQALAAGRDPQMITGLGLWPEHLIEIQPSRPIGGEIVWEWHLRDHLIQDRDPKLRNYGMIGKHPELVDINGDLHQRRESDEEMERLRALGYIADAPPSRDRQRGDRQKADWNHANSVSYNPALDLIALSVLRFGEIWIIDHGTSTEEAAGHSGGKRGRGGDLLYRWGNPQTYRGPGLADRQQLFSQHDVRWIPPGLPGAGNLTVFNNGRDRPGGDYSSVDEILLPRGMSLVSDESNGPTFAAAQRVWSFTGSPSRRFFSGHISGAERLPNANTLVCVGELGRIFEVTREGQIVWDYLNPFAGDPNKGLPPWQAAAAPTAQDDNEAYALARASRLPPDHPGLARLTQKTRR